MIDYSDVYNSIRLRGFDPSETEGSALVELYDFLVIARVLSELEVPAAVTLLAKKVLDWENMLKALPYLGPDMAGNYLSRAVIKTHEGTLDVWVDASRAWGKNWKAILTGLVIYRYCRPSTEDVLALDKLLKS